MRKPARIFEDLVVWQKARLLVFAVYPVREYYPDVTPG